MTAGTFALPLVGLSPSTAARATAAGRRGGLRQFIGGGENRLVESAVRWVAEPETTPFNPLVFCGPSGVGKSHLALGLARAWMACYPQTNVVYLAATDLCRWMNTMPHADDTPLGRRQPEHRLADYLVIDNLDSIAQSPAAQRELVHTLDAVGDRGGRIVLTATIDPVRNRKLVSPLRSRLAAGLVVPIALPGAAARARILRELATAYGVALSACCVRLLAEGGAGSHNNARRTVPELLGLLVQLEFDARSNGCTIDEQQVVAFLARQPQASSTSVQDIGLAVARHFHLPIDDLRSASRKRTLVMARGVTVYLSRKHTRASFMALGQWLGGRDHTTVMHAYQSTVKAIAADETVATAVRHLEAWLDTVKTIGPENSDAGESDTVKYNTGESMSARCRPAVGSSP